MVEPADHGLGRSRGGLTTKLHLACEQGQRPLSIVLTGGQRGDSPQFAAVLNGIRVIWRCWQDRTPYDPSLHGNAVKLAETATPAA